MKLKHFAIPAIAGAVVCQAFAQHEYEDLGRLTIETPLTDHKEDYVNREAADWAVIKLENTTSSYTGHNVNVTNYYDQSYYGIYATGAKYIDLSADEGTWNIITVYGGDYHQTGISLSAMSETSTLSNTQIWMQGTPTFASQVGISVSGYSTRLVLDNVEIHTGMTGNDTTLANMGITAENGATVTNRGMRGVSITSDLTNAGSALLAIYDDGGTIDLVDSTLTATGSSPHASAILAVDTYGTGTVSLTKSSISSASGNGLIGSVCSNLTVNLDNVNLKSAQNQMILADVTFGGDKNDAVLNLNLSNGTAFDGFTAVLDSAAHHSIINLDISSGASWNVTQNSVLGDLSQGLGSLTLDGSSIISFEQISEGSFTNITAAAIALDAGATLMLGATAEEIRALIEGSIDGKYDALLFITDNIFSNEGVILMTSDQHILEYTTNDLGTYTLTAVSPSPIPEPTTGALWLTAFGLFAFRRMKN